MVASIFMNQPFFRGSGGGPVFPPINPTVITASAFWNPATRLTGQDTGLNGAAAPTASAVVRGTGYDATPVVQHSSRFMPCFESNAETLDDYIMIWMTGDPAKIGTRQIDVTFEGTTVSFNCATDAQWDPVKKRYGIPISLRPSNNKNGLARCYIKGIPQNGYERVMSFDVWFNYPGNTNYFDRDANAIYVSGADFNGSGAIGTNDTTVGTSGSPNYRLNRALQFAFGAKEGCYIYIKGNVIDDTAGVSTPTSNVVSCSIRPWPGFTREQTKFGTSGRQIIEFSPNIRLLEFYNIQVDTNSIVNIRGASNGTTRGGFRKCTMLGSPTGGLDVRGIPKGLFAGITTNSQTWVRSNSGEEWSLEDCTGDMYCPAGFRIVSNTQLTYGWDAMFIEQNQYSTRGYSYWGYRLYGPDYARARFHLLDDLPVVSSSYDAVNRWTKILIDPTGQSIQNNSNETAVTPLDGPNQGVQIWAGLGNNPVNYLGSNIDNTVTIVGSSLTAGGLTNYPDLNTVYIKGNDRTAEFPTGRLIRVYNFPHKDAFQSSMQSDTNPWPENGYFQNYVNVALDPQGMLLQSQTRVATAKSGTVSVAAGVATFSASQTYTTGQSLEIRSGANSGKYAVITASGTGITAPVDRPDLDGTSAASYSIGFGECVIIGSTVTISSPVSVTAGMAFHINSGTNLNKYAIITQTISNGTSFTIDRSTFNGTSCVHNRALPLKDFVFENYLVHRTDTSPYLFQWEAVGINLHFLNSTMIYQAANNLYMVIKETTAGFGAKESSFNNCIIAAAKYLNAGAYAPDIVFTNNHFIDIANTTVTATGNTSGTLSMDSEGSLTSNYYPTSASVGTVTSSFVPFDVFGRTRASGDKRGAVAKAS